MPQSHDEGPGRTVQTARYPKRKMSGGVSRRAAVTRKAGGFFEEFCIIPKALLGAEEMERMMVRGGFDHGVAEMGTCAERNRNARYRLSSSGSAEAADHPMAIHLAGYKRVREN
jgi:hypothetical protein